MKQVTHLILITILITISSKNLSSKYLFEYPLIKEHPEEFIQTESNLPSNPDPQILIRTYGYFKAQQLSLERIKKEYPELEVEVRKAEIEFNLSFKKAQERIISVLYSEVNRLYGDEFENRIPEIIDELKKMVYEQNLTKEIALTFIEEVKLRAKGNIESPILETLLTYQFIDNPSKEFIEGFVKSYSTKGHLKAKGVTINAKLPLSWSQREGERPNVIQSFVNKNGNSDVMVLFMVKDLGLPNDYELTQEDINEFFIESELKQYLPKRSEFISANKVVIDNYTGAQLIFKITQQRLDLSITMQGIEYITIFNGKMIFLQCMVTESEGENLNDRFNLFLPLFRQIANSLVLMDQY